jgi:uncharacterized protein (DUF1684 family)
VAGGAHPPRRGRRSPRDVPTPSLIGELQLADWRRRVAALYAEVRTLAATDPRAAWDRWRAVREELYRTHPQSPVPESERAAFRAHHWPYRHDLRFEVRVEREVEATSMAPALGSIAPIALPSSVGGAELSFTRFGTVSIPFPAGERTLAVYWLAGYAGGIFLPFRDTTNGVETYGAGRYLLDGAKSADLGGTDDGLVLDFNFAYHPSCAFDPKWACPLAPPENRLDIRVEAGERLRG